MKPSEFKKFISIKNYDEQTAENDQNDCVTEKYIASRLSKISIVNFNCTNSRFE